MRWAHNPIKNSRLSWVGDTDTLELKCLLGKVDISGHHHPPGCASSIEYYIIHPFHFMVCRFNNCVHCCSHSKQWPTCDWVLDPPVCSL